jgi:phosphatidylglycerophosphatase A
LATAAVVACVVGTWTAESCVRRSGDMDPQSIVIDEIAGQWLVLLAVPPDPLLYGLGFALFRAADIWKPWPVSLADKRVGGGLGVMLDDVLAAIYAGLALYGISFFIGGLG